MLGDIAEEAVERILVNLVSNAANALCDRRASAESAGDAACRIVDAGPIHINVGMLANRIGDPKPWPFRRVRLTVEDIGRGMTQQQLERLVSATQPPSRGAHGIGFRVVQQLVAASGGDIHVRSAPGLGTCVQIEWPVILPVLSSSITDRWMSC